MKLNFTQIGMFLFLLVGVSGLYGQQANSAVITAPAEVAGIYRAIQPTPIWGQSVENFPETPATFVIDGAGNPKDGCSADIENVQGKIAFIDRGDCGFSEKALNAQNGGAVAAVICNDRAIGGIQNMAAGDEAPQVTIPVFAMSLADCARIRILADVGDVNVSFGYQCDVLPNPDVIWGGESGQGDFKDGLGDWTVEKEDGSDTTWYWTLDRVVPGRYTTNTHIVEGSACNGFMVFPSDYYDNNGMYLVPGDPGSGPASGTGLCPNGGLQGNFCTGSLISPNIDLSASNVTGLVCRFYHDWGYYYAGSTSLIASFDGGQTWPDTTHVTLGERALATNPEVNTSGECMVSTANVNNRGEGVYDIPIRGYTGQGQVRLQFKHLGGYYHATIDDVQLLGGSFSDIELLRSFVSRAPAIGIPLSQANEIPLHVDIFNRGNITAENVEITAEATDPSGNIEWSTTNTAFMDQPAYCFLNENSTFADGFTPTQLGNYKMTYKNTTVENGDVSNDTISFGFEMTERTWRSVEKPDADDDGNFNQLWSGLITDDPNATDFCGYQYAIAYPFHLPAGDGNFLNTLRFGVNTLAGNSGEIRAYLYLWDPSDAALADGAYNIVADDRILLGCMGRNSFGEQKNGQPMNAILGPQTDICVKMAVADAATGQPKLDANGELQPIPLQNDQSYVLVFAVVPTQENEIEFIAADAGAGLTDDLEATNFALGNLGKNIRYGASIVCPLTNNGNFVDEITPLAFQGYWPSNQPWIEMDISPDITDACGLTSGTEDITPESIATLEVFPNPVSDVLIIDLSLESVSKRVSFELMNVNGEIVRRVRKNDVKQGRYSMSVGDLPSGIYTLNARSEVGFASKKVVITK